jgi:hypothetical protein
MTKSQPLLTHHQRKHPAYTKMVRIFQKDEDAQPYWMMAGSVV